MGVETGTEGTAGHSGHSVAEWPAHWVSGTGGEEDRATGSVCVCMRVRACACVCAWVASRMPPVCPCLTLLL